MVLLNCALTSGPATAQDVARHLMARRGGGAKLVEILAQARPVGGSHFVA
jgi:hypothetical protein